MPFILVCILLEKGIIRKKGLLDVFLGNLPFLLVPWAWLGKASCCRACLLIFRWANDWVHFWNWRSQTGKPSSFADFSEVRIPGGFPLSWKFSLQICFYPVLLSIMECIYSRMWNTCWLFFFSEKIRAFPARIRMAVFLKEVAAWAACSSALNWLKWSGVCPVIHYFPDCSVKLYGVTDDLLIVWSQTCKNFYYPGTDCLAFQERVIHLERLYALWRSS